MLGSYSLGDNVKMETTDDGTFSHDAADVTMISYVLEAASRGKRVIRALSDDTNVFLLFVYWVFREQLDSKVQMERWDGTVLDINSTCTSHGPNVCSYLACMTQRLRYYLISI